VHPMAIGIAAVAASFTAAAGVIAYFSRRDQLAAYEPPPKPDEAEPDADPADEQRDSA
jgi:hypothetical protein